MRLSQTLAALVFTSALATAASVQAIELRSTFGDRTVVRQASAVTPTRGSAGKVAPASFQFASAGCADGGCSDLGCTDPGCSDLGCGDLGCGDLGCSAFCNSCCGPRSGQWAELEYLLWWRKGRFSPDLVTDFAAPPTTVLFGGERRGNDGKAGGRLTLGTWLDPYMNFGVEARYWQLGSSNVRFAADSNSNPSLGIPFFDDNNGGMANVIEIADPGLTTGSVLIDSTSDVLGGDVLFRGRLSESCYGRVDFLLGYQFSRIDEDIQLSATTTANGGGTFFDSFAAKNEFHGVALGLNLDKQVGWVCVDLMAKVGLGDNEQTMAINGTSQIDANEGIFAQSGGNIGVFRQSEFVVVPEVALNMTYQVSCRLSVNAGATLIYWSNAIQPGDQIDTTLDINNATPNRPVFAFHQDDYWVHGFNAGLTWTF